jgi:hypothetical protein
MRTITKEIKLFTFDELSEKAKEKAITDQINSLLEIDYNHLSDNVKKGIDKSESMLTPWFVNGYIFDFAKDEILAECKEFEYLEDGQWYNAIGCED